MQGIDTNARGMGHSRARPKTNRQGRGGGCEVTLSIRKIARTLQASTLIDRRLYKAICRAKEVAQAQPGYRRDRTWSLLNEVTQHLPRPYQQLVHEALLAPASPHAAAAVLKHLRRAAEKLASDNRTARIQEWKKVTLD